jgi:toxin ParE1/3/4
VSQPVQLHRRALFELREAVKWYENREPGVGWRLWDEVFDALDRVANGRSPGLNAETRWPDRNFKRVFVERYTYTIYFERRGDVCYVWAIAHGRRKPWYWYRRVD